MPTIHARRGATHGRRVVGSLVPPTIHARRGATLDETVISCQPERENGLQVSRPYYRGFPIHQRVLGVAETDSTSTGAWVVCPAAQARYVACFRSSTTDAPS